MILLEVPLGLGSLALLPFCGCISKGGQKNTVPALHLLVWKEWHKIHSISYEKIYAVLLLHVHGHLVHTAALDVALKWPTAEIHRLGI